MIYFTLPNFYFNFKHNEFFCELLQNYPKYFKNENITLYKATGNFPYSYVNGGYNVNYGPMALYNDFVMAPQSMHCGLSLNCSNIHIQPEDYENTMMNLILQLNNNGSHYIEVSDINFAKYLKEKYPYYKLILSKNINLIKILSADEYNMIIDENIFDIIQIPEYRVYDIDFLSQLHQKSKIELTVNSICQLTCQNYIQCALYNQQAQYNFSSENRQFLCKYRTPYHNNGNRISLEDIEKTYKPMGFIRYTFDDIVNNDIDDLLIFLVDYFIKDEYQAIVMKQARLEKI